jgi:hypothetical protein
VTALRRRTLPTLEVAALVRLTKSPEAYGAIRARRRELPYESKLAAGRTAWPLGERVRVYRAVRNGAGWVPTPDTAEPEEGGTVGRAGAPVEDPRDYDAEYYVRLLRQTFASRLARALSPEDFATVFADPEQPSLFAPSLDTVRPILTLLDAAA